jgi:LacI family transcriptional regulator
LGHTRISYISNDIVKLEGYRQALEENGIPFDEELVIPGQGNGYQGGYKACLELLNMKKKITAIFCSTDSYALGAMKCCRERNISIPDEIAIMGHDNLDGAAFAEIPLSSITYNIRSKTDIAVKLLFKRMQNGYEGVKNENIALEPDVIIRESTMKRL